MMSHIPFLQSPLAVEENRGLFLKRFLGLNKKFTQLDHTMRYLSRCFEPKPHIFVISEWLTAPFHTDAFLTVQEDRRLFLE